jgi:hypothetical protein
MCNFICKNCDLETETQMQNLFLWSCSSDLVVANHFATKFVALFLLSNRCVERLTYSLDFIRLSYVITWSYWIIC